MTELRQRQPRVTDPAFLAFLRRLPCCSCSAPPPVQAAHLRQACPELGKRETGKGETPSDRWALPLCADCHLDGPQALHRISEARFLARLRFNPFALAFQLYEAFSAQRARSPDKRPAQPGAKYWAKKRQLQARPKEVTSVSGVKVRRPKVKSRPIAQRKNPWPTGRKFGGRR